MTSEEASENYKMCMLKEKMCQLNLYISVKIDNKKKLIHKRGKQNVNGILLTIE